MPAAFVCEEWTKLRVLADKWRTYLLCRELGIPTPRTVLPVGEGRHELADLSLPVVWKPRMLEAAQGVRIVHTRSELDRLLAHPPALSSSEPGEYPYIVQEHVQGTLHDVVCCAQQGRPVALCTHRRRFTKFEFGGPGLVVETTHERDLMAFARRLLRRLHWNGPVLFEFIRNPAGNVVLLEANPRVWGSTQLTVSAGFNVCQQAVEIFALGRIVPELHDYQAGLVWKWLTLGSVARCFSRPLRPATIARRARALFGPAGGPTVTNLTRGDAFHLVGMTIDTALARTTRALLPQIPVTPASRPLPSADVPEPDASQPVGNEEPSPAPRRR